MAIAPVNGGPGTAQHYGTPITQIGANTVPGRTQRVPGPKIARVFHTCRFNTKAGTPCKMRPIKGSSVCVGHAKMLEAAS